MIIECPECNKKFDIHQNLITSNGRLLQCGSCNHKWFFKLNIIEKAPKEEIIIKKEKKLSLDIENEDSEEIIKVKKKEKKKL